MTTLQTLTRKRTKEVGGSRPGPERDHVRLVWRASGLFAGMPGGEEIPARAQRCFPWSARGRYVSIRDFKENEVLFVRDLEDLDQGSREALENALAEASFVLDIERILDVEEEFEIRQWKVVTRQGPRIFQTKCDEWPREMPDGSILIRDVAGDLYRVRAVDGLDAKSRGFMHGLAG